MITENYSLRWLMQSPYFKGTDITDYFNCAKWGWLHLHSRYGGMYGQQLHKISVMGVEIRREETFVYGELVGTGANTTQRVKFKTYVYYLHPGGPIKDNFKDALLSALLLLVEEFRTDISGTFNANFLQQVITFGRKLK